MKRKKSNAQLAPLVSQHGTPRTRRDFIGQGIISMTATMAAPSILSLVGQNAYGCEAPKASGMMPFICIDLGGGANLAGANVIVGADGGQKNFLAAGSYASLGLSGGIEPGQVSLNEEFGLAFHPESRVLQGMLAATAPATRAKVDGGVFCTISGDDTGNNPHNPMYWLAKAGLSGEVVSLIGTSDNISGGRAAAPNASINPLYMPSRIGSNRDAINLVSAGQLGDILGEKGVKKVLDATKMMSESALARHYKKSYGEQFKDIVGCAYANSEAQLTKYSPEMADPNQDEVATGIFNLNNGDENRAASVAKLILDGMAGGGTITLGGFDYHNNPRTTTDARDLNAGNIVGKILEYASQKQKDLMIYVFTDGGISCRASDENLDAASGRFNASSDSGTRSCAFTLVHKAEGGRPPLANEGRQIGNFSNNGAVNSRANLISNSVENLSKIIVANYLALNGRLEDLANVVGDDPFGAEIQKYLIYAGLVA